ncbi:DUF317 domain-containing protein [Streptomyces sp. NPDC003247]|uniref:DUF317 domain-containing protein n=1 Tax=Streptomyces sp. NPDC003247 TaxID=3364677 RepID=UPI0036C9F0B6
MSVVHGPETVEVDFVAPRHLAGGGDPAWITVPLHRACGWSHGHDPLMPRVILSSPDQKALLRLEPDPDGQWWTLQHTPGPDRPAWYASFGARTPVEIIARFTDALTHPATHPADAWDPLEPLRAAGWRPAYSHNRLASPDGAALAELHKSAGTWSVTTSLDNTHSSVWQARFGEHTPPHLIAAFTTALADPRPVPRTGTPLNIPTRNPDLITHSRREVPATQIATALEDRVRALSVRHTTAPPRTGTAHRSPGPARRTR